MSSGLIKCYDCECNHPDSKAKSTCSFFSFPTLKGKIDLDYLDKRGWSIAVSRCPNKLPSTLDILCSCHFEYGKKKNKPTLFTKEEIRSNKMLKSLSSYEIEKEIPSIAKIKKHLKTLKQETEGSCVVRQFLPTSKRRENVGKSTFPYKLDCVNQSSPPHLLDDDNHYMSPYQSNSSLQEAVIQDSEPVITAGRYSARFKRLLASITDTGTETPNEEKRYKKFVAEPSLPGPVLATKLDPKLNVEIQRSIHKKVAELKIKNQRLKAMQKTLLEEVDTRAVDISYQRERITLSRLLQTKNVLQYYIGFKSESIIEILVDDLRQISYEERCSYATELNLEDQVTLVMILFRRSYSILDLAFRFRISVEEAKVIIICIVDALHDIFYKKTLEGTPFPPVPHRESLHDEFKCLPECRVILESHQVWCQDEKQESSTCYNCFIGVSASKRVIFVSELFEVDLNPREMFMSSDAKDYLQPGDLIIADSSFDISDLLPSETYLNMSPSLSSQTRNCNQKLLFSKARSLIGRTTMQYIKRNFILNLLPKFLTPIRTKVWQLCASLVNYQPFLTSICESAESS